MREFKDDEGRPWRVALTVAAALRVRDLVTVEIDELDGEGNSTGQRKTVPFDIVNVETIAKTFQVLRGQFATIGEVLYAILVAQVEERKLTKDQFLEGLRGDALEAGAKVLEEELIDFFPLRLRRMVGLLAAKMDEVAAQLMDEAEAGIQKFNPESGAPSGKLPESSAYTPEIGPSANSPQLVTAG
jgi:hypothetical protein